MYMYVYLSKCIQMFDYYELKMPLIQLLLHIKALSIVDYTAVNYIKKTNEYLYLTTVLKCCNIIHVYVRCIVANIKIPSWSMSLKPLDVDMLPSTD